MAAQFALEAAVAELSQARGDAATLAGTRSQLSGLTGLRDQLSGARGPALSRLRAEINAAAGAASSTAQKARVAAANAVTAASISLAEAASASRAQVTSVMAGMKDFDPYLHFDSKAEEEAYRRREQERRALIEAEQAKGTPQGDLNASGAAIGQMVDAKAHGAGDSPEFQQRWDALLATTERLREAAKANGLSAEEFDRRLRDDLRRILKSKGLSDDQIEARFAAHPDNPLEAARAIVKTDTDLASLQRSTERVAEVGKSVSSSAEDDMKNLIASLQTAGVVAGSHDPAAPPVHGVAVASNVNATRSI